MHKALTAIALTLSLALAALPSTGCSSSSTTASTSSAVKTCADLTKCCDSLAEPNKSICTASANGKMENLCAMTYDKVCVGDAGSEAGPTCNASSLCVGGACTCSDGVN